MAAPSFGRVAANRQTAISPQPNGQIDVDDDAERWPIECICNLCSCGAHNCSTFEAAGYECAATQNEGNRRRAAAGHVCRSHTTAANERYLVRGESAVAATPSPPGKRRGNQTPAATGAHDPDADELLRVLITRPEIAAKPRDNILFEGDMDLKTTFESTYESLAKLRLEQWRQQKKLAGRDEDAAAAQLSSPTSEVSFADQFGGGGARQQAGCDDSDLHSDDGSGDADDADNNIDCLVADRPASRADSPAAAASAAPAEPPASAEQAGRSPNADRIELQQAGAARPAGAVNERSISLANHIDPDLSPLIVYDANMNRLERIGGRKRSKYRPSTSLRPGARGFFGEQGEPFDGPAHRVPAPSECRAAPNCKATSAHESEFGALAAGSAGAGDCNERQLKNAAANGAGGAGQQPLANARNLAQSDQRNCLLFSERNLPVGSKRRVAGNANLTDHIRDQNIVDGGGAGSDSPSGAQRRKELKSIGTSTSAADSGGGAAKHVELATREPAAARDGLSRAATSSQCGDCDDADERLRRLADEEEAAAIAEIQRCTSIAAATPTAPPETGSQTPARNYNANAAYTPTNADSRNSNADGGGGSSLRQSRLQRTCQNQNFYLHENEYPAAQRHLAANVSLEAATLSGDSAKVAAVAKRRETPTAPRLNLFRESPDFVLSTTSVARIDRAKQSNDAAGNRSETDSDLNARLDEHANGHATADQPRPPLPDGNSDKTQQQLQRRSDGAATRNESRISIQVPNQTASSELKRSFSRHCLVLDLSKDFEFVESRSGHKYYSKKQSSPFK